MEHPYYDAFSPNANQNPFTIPADNYYQGGRRGNRSSMPPQPAGHELMQMGPYGQPYGFPPGFAPHYPYGYPPSMHPHYSPSPNPTTAGSKRGTPGPDGAEAKSASPDPGIKAIEQLLIDQMKREEAKAAAEAAADAEAKALSAQAKLRAEEDKLMKLQDLIIEHNKAQLDREKKAEAARQVEVAATKAAEAKVAEEKKRAEEMEKEVKAAAERAKLEAEIAAAKLAAEAKEKAEKEAAEAKDKHDKALAEAQKKADEFEAAKKKAEEEAKSLRPGDDMLKPPIRFKDAVGRKFSFPWHLCKTWKVCFNSATLTSLTVPRQGMEALIHQAFLHVDVIGQHVHEGHYDLIGPDGEIILPQVWETMVKPDWSITMHMWPIAEPPKKDPGPPGMHGGFPPGFPGLLPPGMKKKGKVGDKSKKGGSMGPPPPPPGMGLPPGMPPGMGLPPPPPGAPGLPPGLMPPGIMPVPNDGKAKKSNSKKKPGSMQKGFMMWAAGGAGVPRGSSSKVRRK
jgi:hypothetical protein